MDNHTKLLNVGFWESLKEYDYQMCSVMWTSFPG